MVSWRKEKMKPTNQHTKLEHLGQAIGLDTEEVARAKRSARNIIVMAIVAGAFITFGNILMPGGPAGQYYSGVSIKDFGHLFSGWL